MGQILGGLIGGVGSIIAGNKAAKQALTGYNYLAGSPVGKQYVPAGAAANDALAELLGLKPPSAQTQAGFDNYLKSTGYNFRLKSGQDAIATSAAARGVLGSGATAKRLMEFGQGLGSSYFDNFLSHLSGVAQQGLQGAGMIGSAGTAGGGNAGQLSQSGTSSGFGQFASALTNFLG